MKNTHKNLPEKPILTDQDLKTWYSSHWVPPRTYRIKLEIIKYIHQAMQGIFTFSDVIHNGFKNSLDLQIEYIDAPFSNLPENDLMRSIKLFGQEVIPQLKNFEPF